MSSCNSRAGTIGFATMGKDLLEKEYPRPGMPCRVSNIVGSVKWCQEPFPERQRSDTLSVVGSASAEWVARCPALQRRSRTNKRRGPDQPDDENHASWSIPRSY